MEGSCARNIGRARISVRDTQGWNKKHTVRCNLGQHTLRSVTEWLGLCTETSVPHMDYKSPSPSETHLRKWLRTTKLRSRGTCFRQTRSCWLHTACVYIPMWAPTMWLFTVIAMQDFSGYSTFIQYLYARMSYSAKTCEVARCRQGSRRHASATLSLIKPPGVCFMLQMLRSSYLYTSHLLTTQTGELASVYFAYRNKD